MSPKQEQKVKHAWTMVSTGIYQCTRCNKVIHEHPYTGPNREDQAPCKDEEKQETPKFQVKIDYEDLKSLDSILDVLADIGKELMFKQPVFSAQIGIAISHGKFILQEYW